MPVDIRMSDMLHTGPESMKGQCAQKMSDEVRMHGDHDQNGRNQVEIKLYRSEKDRKSVV